VQTKKNLKTTKDNFQVFECGGQYKFRTCDPCSVKTPLDDYFPQ
jgi:hypothetical protein